MTHTSSTILTDIHSHPGTRLQEIVARTGLPKSTVANSVNLMLRRQEVIKDGYTYSSAAVPVQIPVQVEQIPAFPVQIPVQIPVHTLSIDSSVEKLAGAATPHPALAAKSELISKSILEIVNQLSSLIAEQVITKVLADPRVAGVFGDVDEPETDHPSGQTIPADTSSPTTTDAPATLVADPIPHDVQEVLAYLRRACLELITEEQVVKHWADYTAHCGAICTEPLSASGAIRYWQWLFQSGRLKAGSVRRASLFFLKLKERMTRKAQRQVGQPAAAPAAAASKQNPEQQPVEHAELQAAFAGAGLHFTKDETLVKLLDMAGGNEHALIESLRGNGISYEGYDGATKMRLLRIFLRGVAASLQPADEWVILADQEPTEDELTADVNTGETDQPLSDSELDAAYAEWQSHEDAPADDYQHAKSFIGMAA